MLTPGAGGQHHKKFLVTCVRELCSAEILVGLEDFPPATNTTSERAHTGILHPEGTWNAEKEIRNTEKRRRQRARKIWARTSSPHHKGNTNAWKRTRTPKYYFFLFHDVVLVSATQQSNQPKLYIPLPPSRWWWDRLRPLCLLSSVPGRTQRNNEGPEITSWHKLWTRFKNPTATCELPGAKAGYLTWALHPAPSRGVLVRAIWFLI